ncbi:MAG TPA: ABC transporter ATP-binding protein [Anaeromyxobacteraceae bacterium]|nr:ABC transporter ATP-binding protein [Anaeromyxobacteraceae bacterium]
MEPLPSPAPTLPALLMKGVGKVFRSGGEEVVALEGIDLAVAVGEFVCLLGPSGCGKSTLLNAVAGFSRPTSGVLMAGGREVEGPGPDRAMVFQEYALFPWMTVEANVAFGLEQTPLPRPLIRERTSALLRQLGLWDFRHRFPKELSGGMRQRVAIARVLAIDPPTLLMDEPFGALDALTRRDLQDELLRIWSELRKTILFVTHGIEEALYLADRVVVMTYRPGRVKRVVPVELARPRDSTSPEFNEMRRAVSCLVLEEQARHDRAERQGGAE